MFKEGPTCRFAYIFSVHSFMLFDQKINNLYEPNLVRERKKMNQKATEKHSFF